MDIGDNIRIIREKQKISQQEIADFLGVGLRTYVSWELGEADIKSSYIPKLAEFLHVEIKDLFRGKPSEIVINLNNSLNNSDNKDTSTNNSIVILVTNKDDVEQIMNIMKKNVGNT